MLKKLLCGFFLFSVSPITTSLAISKSNNYATIQVCFTPGQNCTKEITDVIDAAKKSIFVQAYSFTSSPIAAHLVAAKKRGVMVNVILDKSQTTQKYSASRFLVNQHIPCWIDYKPAIAHNKIMIVDEKEVLTGSFNFTKAAQNKNAENLLIINDPTLAHLYLKNWERRRSVSRYLNPQNSWVSEYS
ncbi:MAG: phospholipase D family protein [Candidatus Rickettsiella isopodorum]|jgi:phosphatidylserine/phosphatidylglycerophosphate/cardiolipin synthase-like enzyme|nr:phospholipase D family protein [Candidatus Rickettsiella isopodorum]MDD5162530.1 phospholipase D family protein [Candidatus Rickettsiella isopodorum]MDQ5900139.1 Phospholipase [Pseudomonadota bacterium]